MIPDAIDTMLWETLIDHIRVDPLYILDVSNDELDNVQVHAQQRRDWVLYGICYLERLRREKRDPW